MVTPIDLTGQVAIVTGAGTGLGRSHALLLAKRGARVVVNDLGTDRAGLGGSLSAAELVVDEIRACGGDAIVNGANVCHSDEVIQMVEDTLNCWGRVDILVNNAGILRDRSFINVTEDDFRAVIDVHLWGTVHATKAVWHHMRERRYGRIVMTTSSSGLYGNFGQSAYGTAKMAVVGLMNSLHLEGQKYDIRVNCLAPSAKTRMTSDIMSQEILDALEPSAVSPAMLALVAHDAPSRTILCAGAGSFEAAHITLTKGVYIGNGEDAPERLLASLPRVTDRIGEAVPDHGLQQSEQELMLAGQAQ